MDIQYILMNMYIYCFSNAGLHVTCVCCRVKEGTNKEMMGILVSYRVKVKLVVSLGG